jgi:hypothetical protein
MSASFYRLRIVLVAAAMAAPAETGAAIRAASIIGKVTIEIS